MFTYNVYPINETLARRAKENISWSDYKEGSATKQYTDQMDELLKVAEGYAARSRFIGSEPERIDETQRYINFYSKRLAEYINKDNEITCRCPSVMIAGPANFPTRKKEKQVNAWRANQDNYISLEEADYKLRYILLQEHAISSADPQALEKLQAKLERLEAEHKDHIASNKKARQLVKEGKAYYEHGTWGRVITNEDKVIPQYFTDNETAEIRRIKDRISQLESAKAAGPAEEISGDTWKMYEDTEAGRICFDFDGKPEQSVIDRLKGEGFRWSPRLKRWQRQNTPNGIRAAKRVAAAIA